MNQRRRIIPVFNFANPQYFWFLLLIPLFIYWDYFHQEKHSLYFSDLEQINIAAKPQPWVDWLVLSLKVFALLFFILALARPQIKTSQKDIFRNGIDIMLALDCSGSMAAEDFTPNRLSSAKKTVSEFIQKRENDRLGLVIFGEYSISRAPLTYDHNLLINLVDQINLGEVGDSTAIGEALVSCLNRLRSSTAKSKVIILVTDGENNSGSIGPLEAAKLAKDLQVKIYTVGIGSAAGAPIPIIGPQYGKQYARNPDGSVFLTKLHADDLITIADTTGGLYYHAENTASLREIFNTIDKLEKVKLKTNIEYQFDEKFQILLVLGLFFILAELFLSKTILNTTPSLQSNLGTKKALLSLTNVSLIIQKLKHIIFFTAIFFIVIALLRPQWGLKTSKVERVGLDLICVLDNSASMYAGDIQPNRLEKSVQEINKLLSNLKGDRAGLITFAGSATPVCPLTTDYGALSLFLQGIQQHKDALAGTNIESAYNLATSMFDLKTPQDKVLVIFSDGENHEGNLDRIKADASAKGITLIPVAVGTEGGQPIPIINPDGSRSGYKKDRKGQIVISHVDLMELNKLAMFNLLKIQSNTDSVINILPELKNLKRSKLKSARISLYTERYQIFLLIGFLLLLSGYLLNDYEDKVYKNYAK